MAETVKLRDTDQKVREFFNARRASDEECVVEDENTETVAAVLPAKRYQGYQEYLRQRAADFAVFDDVAQAFRDVDPEELQARINQAVEEVSAERNARRTTV